MHLARQEPNGRAWLARALRDATGLILGGDAYFPPLEPRGNLTVQSIKSSRAIGAAAAYMLFL